MARWTDRLAAKEKAMAATYDARINELRDLLAQCPAAADDRVNEGFNNLIRRYDEVPPSGSRASSGFDQT